MELIKTYLYNRIPIQVHSVSNRTFHSLKRNGWYPDRRTNKKFTMLNKRFDIGNQWYRVLIRFENDGLSSFGEESFILSLPCPFIITECETISDKARDKHGATTITTKWKDTKTYHGPKLKNVNEFLKQGIPTDLIDQVYADLKEYVYYND